MNKASFFARFVALLIDVVIVAFFSAMIFVAALLGYRAGAGHLSFLGLSAILLLLPLSCLGVFLFYFTYLTMERGATVGKSALGIRVVARRDFLEEETGPGFGRSLARTSAYFLSGSICFLGFLMTLFLDGLTLHDLIAGTRVVIAGPEDGV